MPEERKRKFSDTFYKVRGAIKGYVEKHLEEAAGGQSGFTRQPPANQGKASQQKSENVTAVFTLEGPGYKPERVMEKFKTVQDAVDFGISLLALYFTVEGQGSGRHYTNAWNFHTAKEVWSAADIIADFKNSPFSPEERVISDAFSRVSGSLNIKDEYSDVNSIQEVIDLLKKEPTTARFIIPCNGGLVRLQPEDKVYNMAGQQVWPQPKMLTATSKEKPRPRSGGSCHV